MNTINKQIVAAHARLQEDRGATAVEYGLMVALIAAVIIGAVEALGGNVSATFQAVADKI